MKINVWLFISIVLLACVVSIGGALVGAQYGLDRSHCEVVR